MAGMIVLCYNLSYNTVGILFLTDTQPPGFVLPG
jgi:hypothetical protein